MTGFTTSAFLFRNRVSPTEAFEGLELCEGKLSCTVLRGLDGSNPVRLLGDSETVLNCLSNLACSVSSCRLPQFNRISFRVVQSGKPAVGIKLRVNLDLDFCGS